MKKMMIIAVAILVLGQLMAQEKDRSQLKIEAETKSEMMNPLFDESTVLENKNELYMARLTGKLGLTEEQREEIKPIALKRMILMDKMVKAQEGGVNPSQEFMRGIRQKNALLMRKINAVLTEEQQEGFRQMQKENMKEIKRHREQNKEKNKK